VKLTGSLRLQLLFDGKMPSPLVKTGQLVILTESEIVIVPLALFGGASEMVGGSDFKASPNIFTTIKSELSSLSDSLFRANFLHNSVLTCDAQGNIDMGAIRLTAARLDGEALGNIDGRSLILLGARGEASGQSEAIIRSGLLSSVVSTLSAQPEIELKSGLLLYPVALCNADGEIVITGRITMGLRWDAEGDSSITPSAVVDARGQWIDGAGQSEIISRILAYKQGLLNLAAASEVLYRGNKLAWAKLEADAASQWTFALIRRTDAGASYSSSGAFEAAGRVAINAKMNELQGTSEAIYDAIRVAFARLSANASSDLAANAIYRTSGRTEWNANSQSEMGAGLKQIGSISASGISEALWRSILTANAQGVAEALSDIAVSARVAQSVRNEMSSFGAIEAPVDKLSFARLVETGQSSILMSAIASYFVFCNLSALSSVQFRAGFDINALSSNDGSGTCQFDAIRIGLRLGAFEGASMSDIPQPEAIVVNTAPNDYRLQVGPWGYYIFTEGLETSPSQTNTNVELGSNFNIWIPWDGTEIAGTTATGAINL
jgi:hypothetical protein